MNMSDHDKSFLERCHQQMSLVFDNSPRLPPALAEDGRPGLWLEYLKYKFSYLSELQQNPASADNAIQHTLQQSGKVVLSFFVKDWKEREEAERTAFRLRMSQLPKDKVLEQWYCVKSVDACDTWCELEYSTLFAQQSKLQGADWDAVLAEFRVKVGTAPFVDHDEDLKAATVLKAASLGMDRRFNELKGYLESALSNQSPSSDDAAVLDDLLHKVQRCFGCFRTNPGADGADAHNSPFFGALLPGNLLVDLNITLMTEFYGRGRDITTVIHTFLEEIRSIFQCELCDYLKVETDGPRVRWNTATLRPEEFPNNGFGMSQAAFEAALEREESYQFGEGISGSIFLQSMAPKEYIWNHVGSNNVQNDPRAARERQEAYEKNLYRKILKFDGKIHNFWMFPIVVDGQLLGSFRVVNKLREDGTLQPGGWSYITRVQLALVAHWFSRFLQTILPHTIRISEYREIATRQQRISTLLSELRIGWLSVATLQAFLTYLARVIYRKVEKRASGCCILIVDKSDSRNSLAFLSRYPLVDIVQGAIVDPYDKLDAFLDVVDPLQGAFIFDKEGSFVRLARMRMEGPHLIEGAACIREVTRRTHGLGLLLDRDTRRIAILYAGSVVGDVHVSERIGEWHLRDRVYFRKLLESMASGAAAEVLDIISETCFLLSEKRWGALFFLGEIEDEEPFYFRDLAISFNFSQGGARVQDMEPSLLGEFAKLDGATFISRSGQVRRTNTAVYAREQTEIKIFTDRGTRHKAGEMMARKAQGAVVIIVSENGGISLLGNGCETFHHNL